MDSIIIDNFLLWDVWLIPPQFFVLIVDQTKKFHAEDLNTIDSQEADSNTKVEDSSVPNLKSHSEDDNPFAQQDNVVVQDAPKKRQKLHWGYVSPLLS